MALDGRFSRLGYLALGAERQRLEQYFTSCHTFSHFLRQVKGRPHATQILVSRLALLLMIEPYTRFPETRSPEAGARFPSGFLSV